MCEACQMDSEPCDSFVASVAEEITLEMLLPADEAEATREFIERETERHTDPTRATLETEIERAQTARAGMIEDSEELEERVEDLEADREKIDDAAEQAEEAIDRVETFESEGSVDRSTQRVREGVGEMDMEWMERALHFGFDEVEPPAGWDHHRIKDVHARKLLQILPDVSYRAHDGDIVLETASGLKAKLNRHLDTNLAHEQLLRRCEALAERMGKKVSWVTDHPKLGKHLRIRAGAIDDVALDLSVVDTPEETSARGRQMKAAMAG